MTDGMFITSRDRKLFSVWPESFVRPGLRTRDSWFYGDTYQNWGLVETKSAIEDAPSELSMYVTERTGRKPAPCSGATACASTGSSRCTPRWLAANC